MAITKIGRIYPRARKSDPARAVPPDAVTAGGLDVFGSEESELVQPPVASLSSQSPIETPATQQSKVSVWRSRAALRWTASFLLLAAAAAGVVAIRQRRLPAPVATSSFTVETSPPGVEVVVDGQLMGTSPLTMKLTAGRHAVQLGSGQQRRVLDATVTPGVSLVERVELPQAPPPSVGALDVQSEPAHLPIFLDGVAQGLTPLTLDALAPGDHQITVGTGETAVHRAVSIVPNQKVALLLSAVAPRSAAGWLVVTSPIALQLKDGGRVIGTTEAERLMLPAGEHTLDLFNESLGYQVRRRVTIEPGKTIRLTLGEIPNGTLSINAQPWAEVWLNGRSLGETPIGNLSTPIGSYEVLFRHPDLGERRETILVRVGQPVRIGIDMRKK